MVFVVIIVIIVMVLDDALNGSCSSQYHIKCHEISNLQASAFTVSLSASQNYVFLFCQMGIERTYQLKIGLKHTITGCKHYLVSLVLV